MHKEIEVNIHNPTGVFPLRFFSLGTYIFQMYRYIKHQKVPHGLFQKQIYSPFFSYFSFHHVSNLQASTIS